LALEQRLRQIEKILKPLPEVSIYKPEYIDLLDLPKETVIAAFGILKDAGGYQLMFRKEQVAMVSEDERNSLNNLTPDQFYEMMLTQRPEGKQEINESCA